MFIFFWKLKPVVLWPGSANCTTRNDKNKVDFWAKKVSLYRKWTCFLSAEMFVEGWGQFLAEKTELAIELCGWRVWRAGRSRRYIAMLHANLQGTCPLFTIHVIQAVLSEIQRYPDMFLLATSNKFANFNTTLPCRGSLRGISAPLFDTKRLFMQLSVSYYKQTNEQSFFHT